MAKMMAKLKLQVNQQKTRICHVLEESPDFLGYTLGRCYRVKTGRAYIGTKPSKKRVAILIVCPAKSSIPTTVFNCCRSS
jgi:hypothetical protein